MEPSETHRLKNGPFETAVDLLLGYATVAESAEADVKSGLRERVRLRDQRVVLQDLLLCN